DAWLLVAPLDWRDQAQALLAELSGMFASSSEVSDGWACFQIEGPRAGEVLAKGCSLDLHPRVFRPGRTARTLLGYAPILLDAVDAGPRFDVYVDRSLAEHLWRWLV